MPSALRSKVGQKRLLLAIQDNARRFAMGAVPDEDVEDIASDVVLGCLRKIRSGEWTRLPKNVQALVRKLTADRIADVRRGRKVQNGLTREFLRRSLGTDREWMSPDPAWNDSSIDEYQAEVMAMLPPRCRQAYYLVRVEGDTYEQAAERMRVSPRTVCNHIVSAHRVFREALRALGIGGQATPLDEQAPPAPMQSADHEARSLKLASRAPHPAGRPTRLARPATRPDFPFEGEGAGSLRSRQKSA